jgi:hypothetical protein
LLGGLEVISTNGHVITVLILLVLTLHRPADLRRLQEYMLEIEVSAISDEMRAVKSGASSGGPYLRLLNRRRM